MDNYQRHPLKIYIQDIYRARRTETNKYIYDIFGVTFKNIMVHGVVTSMYNSIGACVNFELTDVTGSVQIFYNGSKTNLRMDQDNMKSIESELRKLVLYQTGILNRLFTSISDKYKDPVQFKLGDYLCVVGDMFLDDVKGHRMVSAYECMLSSVEREVIWLEELQYLYEKYYLSTQVLEH